MGGFFETERMKKHVGQCAACQAAHPPAGCIGYLDCCDLYGDMFNNVIDFESGGGPREDKPEGWLMGDECDDPIYPNAGRCEACGHQWCVEDVHICSSSDCDEIELCGKPVEEAVGGRPFCEEHKL
jgi:hypothetical protein